MEQTAPFYTPRLYEDDVTLFRVGTATAPALDELVARLVATKQYAENSGVSPMRRSRWTLPTPRRRQGATWAAYGPILVADTVKDLAFISGLAAAARAARCAMIV